ncbi:hypothetical protein CLV58_10617 [Spirosoma oryzae]|uniref:Uncharacterized protein n=1 Tax=Spirosoma oryzae TaxID=1469603 RepID=A0A2T0T5D4_9BACT|nr:hypothetical protein [Spirosoma oryzae]PRY40834.1 hypothetical protein CLV58_10617 [Spirosoma oryzae]
MKSPHIGHFFALLDANGETITYVHMANIGIIHESVDFAEYNGVKHHNVFSLDGRILASTPTTLPKPKGWIEGVMFFDPNQSSLADELDLPEPSLDECAPYKIWINPSMLCSYVMPEQRPVLVQNKPYWRLILEAGDREMGIYFTEHPFTPVSVVHNN